ncbi:MAG TPA: GAF domain-containing protein [Anaerolineae bacterium]|nr:GAF domain-containing protein [Anaerolineae bacterium]HQK14344.1 GAF domain-containing protein [Anaerolineae bacterium]
MRNKLATLRARIIGIIVVTIAAIFLIFYIPLHLVLLQNFAALEKQTVSRDIQRGANQIANAIEDLDMTAADYARWDDTYFYMETRDQGYIDANYTESTYASNRINIIVLINTAGEVLYAGTYDFNTQTFVTVPEKLLTLSPTDRLLTPIVTEQSVAGILMVAENTPIFIASQPILTNESQGPAHGVLMMGRFLDETEVTRLMEITQLALTFTDVTAPDLPQDLRAIYDNLITSGTETAIVPLDKETICGYRILKDIYDQPALLLRIDVSRDIYARGQMTLQYLGLALLIASLGFGLTMWWLLGRFVIDRLSSFRAEITRIGVLGSQGDFSSRVPIQGADELSQLESTVNTMLDNLEHYQKELLVQRQRFESLMTVAHATVEQPDLDTTLKNALEAARLLTRAERGSVFVLNELGEVAYSLLSRDGLTAVERQELISQVMTIGLAGWVSRHRQPVLVADTEKDLRWYPLPNLPYTVRSALVVPIFSGTHKLGVLTLTHPDPNHFTQDDLELMRAAADQMALAIRNAQIYDDQHRLAERQTTLYETLRTISAQLDPEVVIQTAVARVADTTSWPAVAILLPDKRQELLVLQAHAGRLPLPERWHIAANYGTMGRAFRDSKTLYTEDTHTSTSSVTLYEQTGSQIVTPLRYGQRILGILDIEHENTYGFRADDIVLAESLADAIALALENANTHAHIRQYAANLNMLYALAQATSQALALETMLPEALNSILESLGFDAGFIGLFDSENSHIQLAVVQGLPSPITEELHVLLNEKAVQEYIRTQPIPLLIEDLNRPTPQIARLQTTVPQVFECFRRWEIHSFIHAPLVQQGRTLGVIGMASRQTRIFSSDDQALQVMLVQQLAAAITNARLFQAMIDERGRLQALIEASHDGIILIDANQKVPVINAAALKLLNLPGTPQAWINRTTLDFLSTLRHQTPEAARTLLKELRRVQHAEAEAAEGEFSVPPHTIHWYNFPVMAEGSALGRLIVLHDITEEHLLKRMREDLTHTTIHDLRNPLTAIYGALEMMNKDIRHMLTPGQEQLLNIARRSTQRMLDLVNALMDINRLESGQMPLEYTTFNLPDLVAEIIESQKPLAINKTLQLENALPPDLPPVSADKKLLERVFQNLIGNAIKFTPSGGTVRLTARRGKENPATIYVSIHDSGPGIPPEILGRLFEKFTTGKQAEHGTGLGLAFCKMVLNAHKEDIWVESTGEQGTTFTFTLHSDNVGQNAPPTDKP